MGMAASQARLLSITARLSDNEQAGQQLSYAKERLADRSDQVTKEYNEALKATKLQIMTGYSDGVASYNDISFKMLTSPQVVADLGRQYCVTDTKGRVLVSSKVAEAFENANGSLNAFLGALTIVEGGPYSLSDVDPSKKYKEDASGNVVDFDSETELKIHEAWDRYFNSINKKYTQPVDFNEDGTDDGTVDSHVWKFSYVDNGADIGQGYVLFSDGVSSDSQVLSFEGTNQEQLDLYNYAVSITESYYSPTHDFSTDDVKTAYDQGNSSMISYYKNLYNKMLTSGYYSYTNTPDTANKDPEHWIYDGGLSKTTLGASASDTKGTPLDDPNTFEQFLKEGKLLLETYSQSANKFISLSISEDTCIQEVEDETKIAAAEAKYEDDLTQIQRLDSKYDLQMKRLDTEHNTLQTEYDSVKNIITKNVESSFKTFG